MKMKKRIGAKLAGLAGLGILMTFGLTVPALADTVYVNASSLNYREAPSMDGRILGEFPRGTKIQRESENGEWSTILVNGARC